MRYLLLVLVISGCVAAPRPVPGHTDEIGFRVTGVNVRFERMVGGKWNAMVQEIVWEDGEALVEAFRLEKGGLAWDSHSWVMAEQRRTMTCYLAVVEDADWSHNGFAHLPCNIDGSVVTSVGQFFNAAHQAVYRTQGRIVERSDEQMTWRIDATLQRVTASGGE